MTTSPITMYSKNSVLEFVSYKLYKELSLIEASSYDIEAYEKKLLLHDRKK